MLVGDIAPYLVGKAHRQCILPFEALARPVVVFTWEWERKQFYCDGQVEEIDFFPDRLEPTVGDPFAESSVRLS